MRTLWIISVPSVNSHREQCDSEYGPLITMVLFSHTPFPFYMFTCLMVMVMVVVVVMVMVMVMVAAVVVVVLQ
ncbi:hypothetical protein E2C01_072450 [Portunus trituberculatus]|uniref:Transmembrane protein n=1 Tax=Portunus trituberculatus TaxID=210409 RepID=A0A5B7HZW9_PORTR|nr:hypothetical protein [Portunus trituberculatus]